MLIIITLLPYQNLKPKQDFIERDHIPSYKALEWFFKNKGNNNLLNIDLKKQNVVSITNKRFRNLNNNLTSINISEDTHYYGRTYGKKNEIMSEFDGFSSYSLQIATLKDFCYHFMV